MLDTYSHFRASASDRAAMRSRYGVTDNTVLYFPCDEAYQTQILDVSDARLRIVTDATNTVAFSATAGAQSLKLNSSGTIPTEGAIPTLSATRSFMVWLHSIPTAVFGENMFTINTPYTTAGVSILGNAVSPTLRDGTTSVSAPAYMTAVVGQAEFRAVFVDRTIGNAYSLQSTNGVAVVQRGTFTALGALGEIVSEQNKIFGVHTVAKDVYGFGASYLPDGTTVAGALVLAEALRVASTTTKILPTGM